MFSLMFVWWLGFVCLIVSEITYKQQILIKWKECGMGQEKIQSSFGPNPGIIFSLNPNPITLWDFNIFTIIPGIMMIGFWFEKILTH